MQIKSGAFWKLRCAWFILNFFMMRKECFPSNPIYSFSSWKALKNVGNQKDKKISVNIPTPSIGKVNAVALGKITSCKIPKRVNSWNNGEKYASANPIAKYKIDTQTRNKRFFFLENISNIPPKMINKNKGIVRNAYNPIHSRVPDCKKIQKP